MEQITEVGNHVIEAITTPFKLTNRQRRIEWMEQIIHSGLERGLIDNQRAALLSEQAKHKGMQRFAFDIAMFTLIEVSPLITYSASYFLNDSTINVSELILLSPSVLRATYTALRTTHEVIDDKSMEPVKTRIFPGIFIALLPIAGALALPAQMGRRYPEMAGFLVEKTTTPLRRLGNVGNSLADRVNKFSYTLLGTQPTAQV